MTGLSPLDLSLDVVLADGEAPAFQAGETVRVMSRSPIAHYRVPQYLRGKTGLIAAVIQTMAVDNEEEAYGRNAGCKGHYYRIRFSMREIWPGYIGGASDALLIEVFQSWLERA
jgi:nitrile hydratase